MSTPANDVTRLITIQPIVVCGDDGGSCAPSTYLPTYITMANTILNQAGIGVAAAPTVTFNSSAYLSPTTVSGAASAFDQVRDLIRLPGHGQSSSPNTLNVFLVDNIVNVTNPAQPTYSYGYGLIGGNGLVLATSPDPAGRVAAPDTLAHELSHNLGLQHEIPPYNLMNTSSRVVADDPCQVGPYSCATPDTPRAQLTTSQVGTLTAPPILTQLPNVVTTATGGVAGVSTTTEFAGTSPSGLTALHVRYRDLTDVTAYPQGPIEDRSTVPPTDVNANISTTPIGPNASVDILLSSPVNYPTTFGFVFPGTVDYGEFPGYYCGDGDYYCSFTVRFPYSTQYDFQNGVTSRTGFDSTGTGQLISRSLRGAVFTFDPNAPGVPTGPSYLPQDIGLISPLTGRPVEREIDDAWSTLDILARIPLPFARFEPSPAAVPEPSGLLVLAAATGVLGLVRGRARRPAR